MRMLLLVLFCMFSQLQLQAQMEVELASPLRHVKMTKSTRNAPMVGKTLYDLYITNYAHEAYYYDMVVRITYYSHKGGVYDTRYHTLNCTLPPRKSIIYHLKASEPNVFGWGRWSIELIAAKGSKTKLIIGDEGDAED